MPGSCASPPNFSDLRFELLNFSAKYELLGLENTGNGGVHFVADVVELSLEVAEQEGSGCSGAYRGVCHAKT